MNRLTPEQRAALDALPATPAAARSLPLASLSIFVAQAVILKHKNLDTQKVMARIIAKHGHKYTAEARSWAKAFSDGEKK